MRIMASGNTINGGDDGDKTCGSNGGEDASSGKW